MKIIVNGKDMAIEKKSSILSFIKNCDYNENTVVIIKNTKVINKALWDKTLLNENDKLEVLSFVGGG